MLLEDAHLFCQVDLDGNCLIQLLFDLLEAVLLFELRDEAFFGHLGAYLPARSILIVLCADSHDDAPVLQLRHVRHSILVLIVFELLLAVNETPEVLIKVVHTFEP